MNQLPVDPEFLKKRMAIPSKIAQLSYCDPEKAIKYIRIWGEHKKPVSELYTELINALIETKVV
ncbi:hypothetical protein MOE23_03710 [Bacillus haynesii]|uniref:hypothetical protein n=1 Tax=Bacillus haynesii TaxID=1925021 RepID=UPI0022825810|nr:hypothetical protein [Bacillus haynesii]MCY8579330.1 hypothetical protein [Bacillus haynesii]